VAVTHRRVGMTYASVPDHRCGSAPVLAEHSNHWRRHVGFAAQSLASLPRLVTFSHQALQSLLRRFASSIQSARWHRLLGLVGSSQRTMRCNNGYDASSKGYRKLSLPRDHLDAVNDRPRGLYARP
jgi:hypothetical protein